MFLTLLQETFTNHRAYFFWWLLVAMVLRHLGLLDDHFISMGSRLVFNFTLPILLFISIATKTLNLWCNPYFRSRRGSSLPY